MPVYSASKDAPKKQQLDDWIAAEGTARKLDDPVYLKKLILRCADGGAGVADHAAGLQFFIVQGGGEGFLGDG